MILRLGLIKGLRYSTMAADMGTYLAKTLFFSSGLHLTGAQIKAEIGRWSNNWPMCEVTEQVKNYCHLSAFLSLDASPTHPVPRPSFLPSCAFVSVCFVFPQRCKTEATFMRSSPWCALCPATFDDWWCALPLTSPCKTWSTLYALCWTRTHAWRGQQHGALYMATVRWGCKVVAPPPPCARVPDGSRTSFFVAAVSCPSRFALQSESRASVAPHRGFDVIGRVEVIPSLCVYSLTIACGEWLTS